MQINDNQPNEILTEDFLEWVIRKEMLFILEDPGNPPEIERAATLIYNWFTEPHKQMPVPELNEWYKEMKQCIE